MSGLFFASAWRSAQPTQNLPPRFKLWPTSMKARPRERRHKWKRTPRRESSHEAEQHLSGAHGLRDPQQADITSAIFRKNPVLFDHTTSAQLMATQDVPGEVRDFILKHIASVAQIEALLLIWSSPEERWGLPQIAARIYTSETETAKALDRLCADGLLVCTDGVFRLNASAENVEMIRKLQEVYARYLIPVTDVIHSKSRNAPSTAETFRLRKDR